MIIIIAAIILSGLGAFCLQISRDEFDRSHAYSMAGYVAFIISFAMLEYGLISMSLSTTFGVWAAGNALLTALIGWYFYGEKLTRNGTFFLFLTLVGLIGMSLV